MHANKSKTGIKYNALTVLHWFPMMHIVANICLIVFLFQKPFRKRTWNAIMSKNHDFLKSEYFCHLISLQCDQSILQSPTCHVHYMLVKRNWLFLGNLWNAWELSEPRWTLWILAVAAYGCWWMPTKAATYVGTKLHSYLKNFCSWVSVKAVGAMQQSSSWTWSGHSGYSPLCASVKLKLPLNPHRDEGLGASV